MLSGPAVALLVEKLDVFDEIPTIVGNEDPSTATSGRFALQLASNNAFYLVFELGLD